MTVSLLVWLLAAVLLFWSVGAYNRLVRLRAEVNAAFAALDAPLLQQAQLAASLAPVEAPLEQAPFLRAIQGASSQLMLSLAAVRARPLAGDDVAALAVAWQAMNQAWERAEREDAHDLAGPQLPDGIIHSHLALGQQAEVAAVVFSAAVDRYNLAIAQFPASLLASLFGFQPGRGL